MPEVIMYNAEAMREQGNKLDNLAERLREEEAAMKAVVDELAGSWSGMEYNQFVEEYGQFKTYIDNFISTVQTFGEYISKSANRAEEADQAAASSAENLIQG